MHDQKVRSQRHGTHNFVMEGLHRARAQHWLDRGQINQVIRMNHQRPQPQFFPSGLERRRIHLGDARRPTLPHPGAGRKNLQGVAAQFARGLQSIEVPPRDGGVDADAHPAIHPGRRQRFGLRFWAVFVFGVELGRYSDALFFGHACRDFSSVLNSLF